MHVFLVQYGKRPLSLIEDTVMADMKFVSFGLKK